MFLKLEAILGKVLGTGCPVPALWTVLPCPGDRRGQISSIPVSAKMALVTAGLCQGQAHDRPCGLNAEYRMLLCASRLCGRLVCPRSHLNRWKESVFFPLALAWGLQWRPQRRLQTNKWKGSKESKGKTQETGRGHRRGRFQLMEIIGCTVTCSFTFGETTIAKQLVPASRNFSEETSHNLFPEICQLWGGGAPLERKSPHKQDGFLLWSWSHEFKSLSKVREICIMDDNVIGDVVVVSIIGLWGVIVRTGPAIWKLSLGILGRQVLTVVLFRRQSIRWESLVWARPTFVAGYLSLSNNEEGSVCNGLSSELDMWGSCRWGSLILLGTGCVNFWLFLNDRKHMFGEENK